MWTILNTQIDGKQRIVGHWGKGDSERRTRIVHLADQHLSVRLGVTSAGQRRRRNGGEETGTESEVGEKRGREHSR